MDKMETRKEKTFIFLDHFSGDALKIKIPEVLNPSYGMYVWPCAPVLAQYIWVNRCKVKGRSVLELGAGTSLPGVLAAKVGAKVTLSDASHLLDCLENCKHSCHSNDLQFEVKVTGVSWGQFDPGLLTLCHIDLILGSDCFYDSRDFEDIVMTVSYLIQKNPGCEFWTTYQDRSSDRNIEQLLWKWGLQCKQVPLHSFYGNGTNIAGSGLPGNHLVQMLIISAKEILLEKMDTS